MTARTKSGRVLADEEIAALAEEAATDEFAEKVIETVRQQGGWSRVNPATNSTEVVPIRFDPELRDSVFAAAEREATSVSELVRHAVRQYLAS